MSFSSRRSHGLHQAPSVRWPPAGRSASAVDNRALRADVGDRRQDRLHIGLGGRHELESFATDLGLQLVGGALGDRRPAVDHEDVVGEPFGLLEVLGRQQQRGTTVDQLADHGPQVAAAARVESCRRLVEEQHRRAGDECTGEVEPATHATRVRLRRPVAGVGEVELLEQLACPDPESAGAEVVQAPDHVEVLEPGEVLVDGGVLAGDADLATGFGRIGEHVDTGDDGRAESGRSSVVRMRTAVVLPAPFGPSRPSTDLRYLERQPGESVDVLIRLRQVSGDDCFVHGSQSLCSRLAGGRASIGNSAIMAKGGPADSCGFRRWWAIELIGTLPHR